MVHVERVGPSEWQRWRDLRYRALEEAPDAFGSTLARERAFDEDDWRRRLADGAAWVSADGVEDVDIGMVACMTHDRTGEPWVFSMWVDPGWRGRGVAAQLLETVVATVRESGATSLGLDVTDRAPRAQRFYERFGFVVRGEGEPLPRDPSIWLYEMTLDLTGPSAP